MRLFAIFLNVVLLCLNFFFLTEENHLSNTEIAIFFLLFITPILNIAALSKTLSDSFIFLYFKRRSLEEKKKIEKLQGE